MSEETASTFQEGRPLSWSAEGDKVRRDGLQRAAIVGQLAGNHFLTVIEGNENLRALGEMTLWQGAQDIVFAAE